MVKATAQAYSDIRFRQPISEFIFELPAAPAQPQAAAPLLPSDQKLGEISGPVMIAAKWISTIQRRIKQSVPTYPANSSQEGWLDSDIATYAVCFFNAVSDVLPASEPYLYTANNGDLVAEFAGKHGKLTSIIGKAAVNSFVIVEGQVLKATLNFPLDRVKARRELMQITKQL
jgi:hypothetical protein